MDKVQKIREEVKKRYEYWREKEFKSHSIESEIRMSECQHLLLTIDSLQEEPVSEELEEASKEWLRPQLDKSYVNYGEAKMMELTHFDGYAMLDAIEFGAKWQKEQIMAKVIEGGSFSYKNGFVHISCDIDEHLTDIKLGDKVKVIVIKED